MIKFDAGTPKLCILSLSRFCLVSILQDGYIQQDCISCHFWLASNTLRGSSARCGTCSESSRGKKVSLGSYNWQDSHSNRQPDKSLLMFCPRCVVKAHLHDRICPRRLVTHVVSSDWPCGDTSKAQRAHGPTLRSSPRKSQGQSSQPHLPYSLVSLDSCGGNFASPLASGPQPPTPCAAS